MYCVVCRSYPIDTHHIKTRGSGGTDNDFNLVKLCRKCHARAHQIGMIKMMRESIDLEIYLKKNGWDIVNIFGVEKLVRD